MTGAAAAILTGCRHRCGATGRAGRAASELLASGSIAAFFLLHSFQLCWCRAGLGWLGTMHCSLSQSCQPSAAQQGEPGPNTGRNLHYDNLHKI